MRTQPQRYLFIPALAFFWLLIPVHFWGEETPLTLNPAEHRALWPREVVLKEAVTMNLRGNTFQAPAGARVQVQDWLDGQLLVAMSGAEAKITLAQSDFLELLESRLARSATATATATAATAPIAATAPPIVAPEPVNATTATPSNVSFETMNRVFGVALWNDKNLWGNEAATVAQRLQWPLESRTSGNSSYRLYAKAKARVLGARPYSLVLYGAEGKADQLSLVFANKGDFSGIQKLRREEEEQEKEARDQARQEQKVAKDFAAAVRADAETITKNLTAILGEPEGLYFGVGSGLREKISRWNWEDHAILLAAPKEEYVSVRIMPVERANNNGRVTRINDMEMKAILSQRVVKRPNGDVVISEIPMVDQGPKGFCVPATWERYLRYMGIPADMYLLAMVGQTGLGGGTYLLPIAEAAGVLVNIYARKLERVEPSLTVKDIAKYIDKGLPMMWACYIFETMEQETTVRTQQRNKISDLAAYTQELTALRKKLPKKPMQNDYGHMRMITGYNETTGEIAISDSWGAYAEERWMLAEEAALISQDYLMVIKW
jgi:hypothetical protein